MADAREEFVEAVAAAIGEGSFTALQLTDRASRDSTLPRRQSVRPVQLRGKLLFQWELQFEKQQTHLNLNDAETLSRLREELGTQYRQAQLQTPTADLHFHSSARGSRCRRSAPSRAAAPAVAAHNRTKPYLIPDGTPCPFLIALDVMAPNGQVRQSRQKKFRQINRYLELVEDTYRWLPAEGPIRVVDFGCGLSYLTFALHHLLTVCHGRDVQMTGIDQNADVISRCQEIASRLELPGLEFTSQKIEQSAVTRKVDLAVSLHACDTATDAALAYAVASEARVILAAPCCQHELFTQLQAAPLESVLRHGILKERLSALVTDALRGCALEAAGYRTQILEFIDLEHTPKNLLLRAVQRNADEQDASLRIRHQQDYDQLKAFCGAGELATDAILRAARQTGATAT